MSTRDILQAICIELRHILRSGWELRVEGDEIRVLAGSDPDLVSEVWRIARFVAYDDYVSIERVRDRSETGYRIFSRGQHGAEFHISVMSADSR